MQDPVPILFTIPNFVTAGSGRALLNIVTRLDRERLAPAICVLRRGGHLEGEVIAAGIPYLELPFTVPAKPYPTLFLRAARAAKLFRPYRFALWHSFHYLDDYTEPLIARLAGSRSWVYTKKNMNWGCRSWYLRSWLASGIAAQNSDMVRNFFASPWLRRKTRSVPRGVDTETFRPGVERRLNVGGSLGLSSGSVVVGCVAHLIPVKGHPTLIQAVAGAPGVELVIAGDPLDQGYADGLRKQCEDLGVSGRVHFVGGVRDVPAFLAELDLFVLPTWAQWRMEGCPVALLEAMSCGLACIATDIPGSRDLIEHGHSGWIVPPEDPAALAAAIRELAGSADRRLALGLAARERTVRHFSIESEVAAHEALYAELLGAR